MKVIIQDVDSCEYLSTAGNWVAPITEAQDFVTLLRAYNFAQAATSRNFQVMLYCPDDSYTANIISGAGAAPAETKTKSAPVHVPIEMQSDISDSWSPRISVVHRCYSRHRLNMRMLSRAELN